MRIALFRLLRLTWLILRYAPQLRGTEALSQAGHQALMRQFCCDVAAILGMELHYSGQPMQRPGLLVPNHISWHDAFAVGIPCQPIFVTKAEVARWPLLGYIGRQGRCLFINRGSRQAARQVTEQMTSCLQQRSVLVFAEGTTTLGDTVKPFRRRLFAPALHSAVPVQPIAIHYYGGDPQGRPLGYGEESFLAHFWRTLTTPKLKVGVHFCSPFYARDLQPGDLAALAREAERRVIAAKQMLAAKAL